MNNQAEEQREAFQLTMEEAVKKRRAEYVVQANRILEGNPGNSQVTVDTMCNIYKKGEEDSGTVKELFRFTLRACRDVFVVIGMVKIGPALVYLRVDTRITGDRSMDSPEVKHFFCSEVPTITNLGALSVLCIAGTQATVGEILLTDHLCDGFCFFCCVQALNGAWYAEKDLEEAGETPEIIKFCNLI